MRLAAIAGALLITTALPAQAEVNVVASIKPVHSLVAAVMEGAGTPQLIVDGASSPHNYALKPSQARALQDADIVFWVGHEMETFLEEPLESLSGDAHAISLFDVDGLTRLPYREGGAFEGGHDDHDHGEHGHDDHAKHDEHGHEDHADHKDHDDHGDAEHKHGEHGHNEHGHKKHEHAAQDEDKHSHDKHDHEKHEEEHAGHDGHGHEEHAHGGSGHEGHNHGDIDAHVWLDPENARVMVKAITEELAEHDPENAALYASNAAALDKRLAALVPKTEIALLDVVDARFVVFHDAYRYFEERFGLTAAGAITVNPEVPPGAARVREIRELASDRGVACIFSEPQFNPAIVEVIADGTDLQSAVLDPLGAGLEPGPELYETLIADMTKAFRTCLGGTS